MPPAFQLLLCLLIFMLIHISVMALCARACGITVRSISYGVGPTLLRWGKVRVKLLPLAGNVVLKDTREETLYDDDPCLDTYNFQPLWKQFVLPLSGVTVLLALSLGIMGASGWASFWRRLRTDHPRCAGTAVDGTRIAG